MFDTKKIGSFAWAVASLYVIGQMRLCELVCLVSGAVFMRFESEYLIADLASSVFIASEDRLCTLEYKLGRLGWTKTEDTK